MDRLLNNPNITITICPSPEIENSEIMSRNGIKRPADNTDPNQMIKQPRLEDSETIISPNDTIDLVSSEDDNNDKSKSNPITAIASKQQEYTNQLFSNPRSLDDIFWKKIFKLKDYYRIKDCCKSIYIGNFVTKIPNYGEMVISVYGIRMTVENIKLKPVTIDIHMDNILNISHHYNFYDDPQILIVITTDRVSSVGIQYLLNMNEDSKMHYCNLLTQDPKLNRVIWSINKKYLEHEYIEDILKKLPISKVDFLTESQVVPIREEIRNIEEKRLSLNPDHINILKDKVNKTRFTINVLDYKMLSANEFVNDNLIEYYFNYWYSNHLSAENKQKTYILSTYFYTRLTSSCKNVGSETRSRLRHNRVKKWTKNVNIFQKDFIFIPIHDVNHWYLAVICFPYLTGKIDMKDGSQLNIPDNQPDSEYQHPQSESFHLTQELDEADPSKENLWLFDLKTTQNASIKLGTEYYADVAKLKQQNQNLIKQPCIIILDSLSNGYPRAKVAATLREWLDEEYKAKHNGKTGDFSPKVVKAALVKVPQQTNAVDCGFFVMHFFQKFFEKPIVDFNFPINHLENWFLVDEVSKNCQKRAELKEIILTRMAENGTVRLPPGMALPVLDFRNTNFMTRYKQDQSNLISSHDESMDKDVNNDYSVNDNCNDDNIELEYENEEYYIETVDMVDEEEESEDHEHNYDDDTEENTGYYSENEVLDEEHYNHYEDDE